MSLCECGCGQETSVAEKTYAREGIRKGEHRRFIQGHHYANPRKRFWKRVDVRGRDDCWEWLAGADENGYGCFFANGKRGRAHRYAYEMSFGEIPDGLCVCHRCDNPACVNPRHLWAGTVAENNRDAARKGRAGGAALRGEKNSRAKLTARDVEFLRAGAEGGVSGKRLARIFGISSSTASKIIKRKMWTHVH